MNGAACPPALAPGRSSASALGRVGGGERGRPKEGRSEYLSAHLQRCCTFGAAASAFPVYSCSFRALFLLFSLVCHRNKILMPAAETRIIQIFPVVETLRDQSSHTATPLSLVHKGSNHKHEAPRAHVLLYFCGAHAARAPNTVRAHRMPETNNLSDADAASWGTVHSSSIIL